MVNKVSLSLFAILLCSFAVCTPVNVSIASDNENINSISLSNSNSQNVSKAINRFLVRDTSRNYIYFNVNQARIARASQDLIMIGQEFNNISMAYTDRKSRLDIPVWGNYCGPGHSGPGKPIDLLDTACMHHDNCYGKEGYWSCNCDKGLVDEINSNLNHMTGKQKAMAYAVKAYFSAQMWWNDCKK